MSSTLSPYLVFNGQTREVLAFYASIFGGTPQFTTAAELGAPPDWPADAVMHGALTTDAGWTIMAADSTKPGDEVVRGGMNLTVWGDDDAMRDQFERLAEGGTVNMPLAEQPWGAEYCDLTDKFGIGWGFNIGNASGAA